MSSSSAGKQQSSKPPPEPRNKKRDFSQQSATPITAEGERPQKKFYRQRAHCNPLAHNDSYEYPARPEQMRWHGDDDWLYPPHQPVPPTVLDVGCGFGGLTMRLAELLPRETVLGLEIRAKVAEYVRLRIVAARRNSEQGTHRNAAVLRTNSMKFLPNHFRRASVSKIFLCFPDPHFKRKNHPRRIVSVRLLSEYAYALRDGGRLYCITDVGELHQWHVRHLEAHPLFRRVVVAGNADGGGGATDDRIQSAERDDPCIAAMKTATEEGQKVERNGGDKHYAVYERIADADAAKVNASNFFLAT